MWQSNIFGSPGGHHRLLYGVFAGGGAAQQAVAIRTHMQSTLSAVGLLMMVAALLGLFALRYMFSPALVVIALQVCAGALMLWARLTFGMRSLHAIAQPTSGGLVTRGPYRYIRHPIYTAVCLFVWPAAIAHASWAAVGLATLLTAGAIVRLRCEESLLVMQYPDYAAYAARTKRMIPFVF
jgi:protein-S-isoprenylcysteine O-methyltransferase Ste14